MKIILQYYSTLETLSRTYHWTRETIDLIVVFTSITLSSATPRLSPPSIFPLQTSAQMKNNNNNNNNDNKSSNTFSTVSTNNGLSYLKMSGLGFTNRTFREHQKQKTENRRYSMLSLTPESDNLLYRCTSTSLRQEERQGDLLFMFSVVFHLLIHQSVERLSQRILHRGLWIVQLSTKGQGLHSVFLPRCPGTSLAFKLTLSECSLPCPGWRAGVSNDWCITRQTLKKQVLWLSERVVLELKIS